MIQRYYVDDGGRDPSPDGPWCNAEDVAALEARLARLAAALKPMVDLSVRIQESMLYYKKDLINFNQRCPLLIRFYSRLQVDLNPTITKRKGK